MALKFIDNFENDTEIKSRYYGIWNDEDLEKSKAWYVDEVNYAEQCEASICHAKEMGLYQDISKILGYAKKGGKGVSLASGTCWDAGVIVNGLEPKEMEFLDFSKHRVFKNAPPMLRDYLHLDEKCEIGLIHGDYYKTRLNGGVYDFVTLSMALMMAEFPDRLLREVRRILKDDGVVLIVGEPRFSTIVVFKSTIKIHLEMIQAMIFQNKPSERVICYRQRHSHGTDESGANSYSLNTYKKMFKRNGFKIVEIVKDNPKFWGFVLEVGD